jgi:hypothetical protein
MFTIKKIVGLSAGVAAIAAAAPASAQYYGYSRYGTNYGYNNYGYGMNTNAAASQCTAAVQSRLYNRTSLGSILGSLVGVPTARGQVLSITQVTPRNNGMIRVRGLASSGRYASNGYGPYGVGAYGALGYGYNNAADLSFRCDVGYNGAVYDVHINRR